MQKKPRQILKNIFGYDNFRGSQEEIINHVIAGESCFVMMPTGEENHYVTRFRLCAAKVWRLWFRL